jgi:phage FluMu protein Com
MATWLLQAGLEVACPRCEYPLWVTGAEIIAQVAVTCPCCRVRVWLIDSDGRFQNAGRDLGQALEGLGR